MRYVLEGGVRKSGSRLRITGQLIDAVTGAHLWADRFDGGLDDVFDLQDRITASVVGAIEPTMRKAEIERRAPKTGRKSRRLRSLSSRATPCLRMRPDENLQGLDFSTKRSNSSRPMRRPWPMRHGAMSNGTHGDGPLPAQTMRGTQSRWLVGRLPPAATMRLRWSLAGFVLVMVARDYRAGLDAVRRAVERNPGSGFVNFMAGTALVFRWRSCRSSLALMERAMALGPLDPSYYMYSDGCRMGPALQRSPRRGLGTGRTFGLAQSRLGLDLLGPDSRICSA